jgi:membrane protein DedA with SNARE-associated domain
MGLTELLINFFTSVINVGGYWGITFLMILESMVAPVPSEAVMPFAGFLWFLGKMNFGFIVLFSTLGSIIGSLISYAVGYYGGRPLILKFGKYLLLNESHLATTEKFFGRYGDRTIFISRFIPVVRHLISLPAGVGQMKIGKFIFYTIVGAGLWNAFLTWLGYYLGSRWEIIRRYSEVIDILLVILLLAVIVWWIYRRKKNS